MSLNLFIFFVFVYIAGAVLNGVIEGNTNIATTSLTADVSKTDTTITVHNAGGFRGAGLIIIDDEFICYEGKTATTFTGVTRGADCQENSAAAEHAQLDGGLQRRVYSQAPGIINVLVGFDIATSFSDGGVGGFFKGLWNTARNIPAFMQAVARMIAWDYNYLDGAYVYVKYFLLYPLSAGLVLAFVRMATGR